MNKENWSLSRLYDLAERCDRKHIYTYSDFLSQADLSDYLEKEREFSYVQPTIFGGMEDAERVMIRFGSEELLGYAEEFPIATLKIAPLQSKFADAFTHRDFLGALMHLGIEREVLGDIVLLEDSAFLFCKESMAEFIMESLTKVKHTSVRVTREPLPELAKKEPVRMQVQVASERLDALIAKVFHLSREQASLQIKAGRVFVNGRVTESQSTALKPEDLVTLRGYGRFRFIGNSGFSKKGKMNALVEI